MSRLLYNILSILDPHSIVISVSENAYDDYSVIGRDLSVKLCEDFSLMMDDIPEIITCKTDSYTARRGLTIAVVEECLIKLAFDMG